MCDMRVVLHIHEQEHQRVPAKHDKDQSQAAPNAPSRLVTPEDPPQDPTNKGGEGYDNSQIDDERKTRVSQDPDLDGFELIRQQCSINFHGVMKHHRPARDGLKIPFRYPVADAHAERSEASQAQKAQRRSTRGCDQQDRTPAKTANGSGS
jgi:hypothetical protein